MRPKFSGIAVVFYARDVERTQRFYEEHLGIEFERNVEQDGTTWLMARISPGTEMLVFPGDPKPGNTPIITFGLADGGIDTLVESLAASGVEIVTPVSEAPGGWSSEFRDLDGHVMSFFQAGDKPKKLT